jgi:putative Mn2+ efflux pump MntP
VPFDWLWFGTGIFGIIASFLLVCGLKEIKKKKLQDKDEGKKWKEIILNALAAFKLEKRISISCLAGFVWCLTDTGRM